MDACQLNRIYDDATHRRIEAHCITITRVHQMPSRVSGKRTSIYHECAQKFPPVDDATARVIGKVPRSSRRNHSRVTFALLR